MMNNKKKSFLALAMMFTSGVHAAFDQFGVSIYSSNVNDSFFVGIDLPEVPLASSPVLDFTAEYLMPLMPTQDGDVEEFNVSVTAVPVPSSLLFFGSALVALTVIQRRA